MKTKNTIVLLLAAAALGTQAFSPIRAAQALTVSVDHTNGVYAVGEVVHWRLTWQDSGEGAPVRYRILQGGLTELAQGDVVWTNRMAEFSTRFTTAGTLLFEATLQPLLGKSQRFLAGAVAAPEQIGLSAPRPADFDEFWESQVRALSSVPMNVQLVEGRSGKTNVTYSKVTMANINGTHIHGQIARPVQGQKFPALLIVQWAGVYALMPSWVTDRAAEGWLALDIEAHDLPIDEPESFYKEQAAGPLRDYPAIGNTNRETSYFLRMYLSCYRAAEYLAGRPDWDGRTLVVMGGSQGGLQALMTAGLHPRITAALAIVPAGCDMLGPEVGRSPGWPQWYWSVAGGKDPRQVRKASRYYDAANFASRIKCPILVGVGLQDETCPPAGIFATVNQVRSSKEIVILPHAGHNDEHGTHKAYERRCYDAWLPALRQGAAPPLRNDSNHPESH